MGRRLLAIGLAVALQAGALTSPLVHAHLDDHHDDHHAASQVHAHLGGHAAGHSAGHGAGHHEETGGTAMHEEEAPERIVALAPFVATHADAGIEPAVAPALFLVASPSESIMRRPPEVVRSHGPPPVALSAPRAPPVFPS